MSKKSKLEVDKYGTKRWLLNRLLHRVDGPAIEYTDGNKRWYLNGELHRVDGPAVEYHCGAKKWYLNGKLHREDGPASLSTNGLETWWLNDIYFKNKEDWFNKLTSEQQYNYLWNLDE
jgi:hypothetical protein